MKDEVWKSFFDNNQTRMALDTSEVWQIYSQAELAREQLHTANKLSATIDHENQLMSDIDSFRQRVASNPALKARLKQAFDILKQYPELKDKADPNFINGLELLDLGD